MKTRRYFFRHNPVLPASILSLVLSSCTIVGPTAISSGRLAYNEAIASTNNQQMLMVLVHNRYDEQGSMLAVSSVTANVSVTNSVGLQTGFGANSDYRGNLVPFSGGFIYEENPTISYTPVAGEKYLRQLTSPLPIAMLAQITRTMTNPAFAFEALISSVNGIYNPDFIFHDQDEDPRFDRFVTLMSQLTRSHRLSWVEDKNHEAKDQTAGFSILIDRSAPDHSAMVQELLDLLGLADRDYQTSNIVIPVTLSLNGKEAGAIGITTRSVFDLVEILSAKIELPAIDIQDGVVGQYPPVGRLGKELVVHYSEEEPERAYIAVEHRDGWFYIDERDRPTKAYFKLLGSLWSLAVASSLKNGPAAPVLTVPVSN